MHDVPITVENYGKILGSLEPRLSNYKRLWSYEFKRDPSDIEEDIYFCLLDAIKSYRKERGKFETFFIACMRHRLFNTARDTYKEKIRTHPDMLEPCITSSKKPECQKLCRRMTTYKQNRRCFNALPYKVAAGYSLRDFTQMVMNRDYYNQLMQCLLQKNPEYTEVVSGIQNALMEGLSEEKAIRRAVIELANNKRVSKAFLYNKINRLRKWLEFYDKQMLNK